MPEEHEGEQWEAATPWRIRPAVLAVAAAVAVVAAGLFVRDLVAPTNGKLAVEPAPRGETAPDEASPEAPSGSGDTTMSLDMGDSDFTLSAWVKGDPLMNEWARILDKGYFSGYELGRTGFASTIGFTYLNSDPTFSSTSSLIDNTWHHVAVVKSGGTASLYIDGILQSSIVVNLGAPTNTFPMFIGYNPGEGIRGHWKGQLDEVRIYDRALTPGEVQGNFNARGQ